MRTKNELYQQALRTVAMRRQTARALAQDAQAEAEAAIPGLRHAEEEVRVRGIRCALAGAAGKDRTGVAAMLILLALVVALAVVSVTTVAKLSSVNSRNIAMMQEQCRDAVALSTTLSRTASSSSAATVGKIRADVHAIDVINQMKMLQDGTNHAYVSTELISRIYTILDAYSNQLITGMSTMEEQTNLSAALQELSAALSGL